VRKGSTERKREKGRNRNGNTEIERQKGGY